MKNNPCENCDAHITNAEQCTYCFDTMPDDDVFDHRLINAISILIILSIVAVICLIIYI